jgi:hypothetical protein
MMKDMEKRKPRWSNGGREGMEVSMELNRAQGQEGDTSLPVPRPFGRGRSIRD